MDNQQFSNIYSKVQQNNLNQTNKWIVQSLQEALNKFAPPNSVGVYFSQDGEFEYEISTDINGIKSYETYKRTLCSKDEFVQIPTNDYKYLLSKITELETKVNGKSSTSSSTCSTEMQGSTNENFNSK